MKLSEEPLMELEEGQLLGGRFRLGARLGRSELGEAYAAVDQHGGRECAVKVLVRAVADAPDAWSAFRTSAEDLRSLALETIAVPSESGVDPNLERPFFVSDLIAFPSVIELVQRNGATPIAFWAQALATLGRALAAAERIGYAHGDLKPQNLFFFPQNPNFGKVADFGMITLRRACRPAHGPGSLGFAPPEELDGSAPPSGPGDVYALGMVSFYALTARHALRAMWEAIPEPERVLAQLETLQSASEHAASLGASLPSALDAWFARALDRDPARRFRTPLEAALEFSRASGVQTQDCELALSSTLPAPPSPAGAAGAIAPTVEGSFAPARIPATLADGPPESRAPSRPRVSGKRRAGAAAALIALTGVSAWGALRASSKRPATHTELESAKPSPPPSQAPASSAMEIAKPATRARLACAPVDCEFIVCDGQQIPSGVREVDVIAGKHRCSGSHIGYHNADVEFTIDTGALRDVHFTLVPVASAATTKTLSIATKETNKTSASPKAPGKASAKPRPAKPSSEKKTSAKNSASAKAGATKTTARPPVATKTRQAPK